MWIPLLIWRYEYLSWLSGGMHISKKLYKALIRIVSDALLNQFLLSTEFYDRVLVHNSIWHYEIAPPWLTVIWWRQTDGHLKQLLFMFLEYVYSLSFQILFRLIILQQWIPFTMAQLSMFPKMLLLKWICCCKESLNAAHWSVRMGLFNLISSQNICLRYFVRIASVRRF